MSKRIFGLKSGETENAKTKQFEANVERFCTGNTVPLSKEAVKFLFDLITIDRYAAEYLSHYYCDVLHTDVANFGAHHITSTTDSSVLLPYLELHEAVLKMIDEIFKNDETQRGHGFHALLKTSVLYGVELQDAIRNSEDYDEYFDAADIVKDEFLDSHDQYNEWIMKIKDYIQKYLIGKKINREITFPMISVEDIEAFKKIRVNFPISLTRALIAAERSKGTRAIKVTTYIDELEDQLKNIEEGMLFPDSTNYDVQYRAYFVRRWEGWQAMGWKEGMDVEEFFNSKF